MGRHQYGMKPFTALAFTEQGKSIGDQAVVLDVAMHRHLGHLWLPEKTHHECLDQVRRLLVSLEAIHSV